ncbi:MAG: DEAD/DEAH box helicase [Patescibacteria group bacterium]|nr:DEAD/DEAH box helicase [Patescibacteria group bacterium]
MSKRSERIDEAKFINKATENNTIKQYAAVYSFSDFEIDSRLKANILNKGFDKPTAIQDQAIPEIINGKDIIGLADTGTGKTAAFLIPLINKVLKNKNERILIVAPTRELAEQINVELSELTKGLRVYSVLAIGGANIRSQVSQLKRGYDFVIGTPGRLKDLLNRGSLKLSQINNVVLDEADRMLDMGFINDIKLLLGNITPDRQTLFFSATFSKEVEKLSSNFLRDPVRIATKIRDTSSNVDQDVVKLSVGQNKIDVLHDLLIKDDFKKVLIFGKTKWGVEKLSKILAERGFRASSIHGDKSQSQRERALRLFKAEEIDILVATDVAARGLDIPDVSHVINYDLPATYEDYIHRIGRTGRAYKKGVALTFVGGEMR